MSSEAMARSTAAVASACGAGDGEEDILLDECVQRGNHLVYVNWLKRVQHVIPSRSRVRLLEVF